MNTRALKKFELENHKLASACQKLLDKGNNLEREIALYEHDREALMEFGNEADEREQQAKSRVLELERNLQLVVDELKDYKHQKDLMVIIFALFFVNLSEFFSTNFDNQID